MEKKIELANDPALTPEERERQQQETDSQQSEETYGRQTYLIDRNFQYRFATTWIAMVLLYVILITSVFYWSVGFVEGSISSQYVQDLINDLSRYVGLFIIMLTILFGLYFVLLSHRISGPAYRINESLKRIARGEFQFTVQLRETDYLKSIAEHVNRVLDRFRERNKRLGTVSDQVETIRSGLEEEAEEHEDLIALCDTIQEDLEQLRTPSVRKPADVESGEEG